MSLGLKSRELTKLVKSHNQMNAFFSSTDDNDSRTAISYSGVVGKLTEKSFETVWRFDYYNRKIKAELEQIFDAPAQQDVPEEWMKQIKTQTYPAYGGAHHNPYGGAARQGNSYYPGTGGHSYPGNGRAGTWEHPQNQKPKAAGNEASSKSPFPVSTLSRTSGERLGPTMQPGNYQKSLNQAEAGGGRGKANADEKEEDRQLRQQLAEGDSRFREEFRGSAFGFNIHDFYSGLYDDSPDEVILKADEEVDEEDYDKAFGKEGDDINVSAEDEAIMLLDEIIRSAIPFEDDPRFAELAIEMGKYRAGCFLFVEMASSLFNGEDKHLNNIIFEYYQMLSEEGKGKLFRGLVEILPDAERRKVEAYGL